MTSCQRCPVVFFFFLSQQYCLQWLQISYSLQISITCSSAGVSDWSRWDSIYFMSKKSDVANTPFHISAHTAWSRKAYLTMKADIVVAVISEILGYGWLCVKLSPGLHEGTQQCRFYTFDSRVWNYTCQPFLPFQGKEVTDLSDSMCRNEYTGFLKW